MSKLNWFEMTGRFGASAVVRTRAEMHAWLDEYLDGIEENQAPSEKHHRLTIDASVAASPSNLLNGHDDMPEEDVLYWRDRIAKGKRVTEDAIEIVDAPQAS